ncbi:MAG: DUF5667 domain-containing protein, partial [Pseudonocardiaceae bacterium]
MIRNRKDAETLDRALTSQGPWPRDDLAELVRLRDDLAETWAAQPDAQAEEHSRRVALAAFRTTAARATRAARARLRRRLAVIAAAVVVVTGGTAVAAPAVERSLPGDAAYSAKLTFERARHVFAIGAAAEASLYLGEAETRLEEAVRAQSESRAGVLPDILARYHRDVRSFEEHLARSGDQQAELTARAAREFGTHQEVLTALLGVVPGPARPGIERAIEASRRGPPEGAGPPVGAG